jgi:tetraacyldisaccharide 4'-kinase
MKTPVWWKQRAAVAYMLYPLSFFWRIGAWLRPKLTSTTRVNAKVICIGNVVAGGGGKTPIAIALGEAAKRLGINAYFISRGYGGNITTPTRVDITHHTAQDVGDEPLLLARTLPTIVARSRVHAAQMAVAEGASLIIMDDGLQNPALHKDISILVLKGNAPLGNGWLMPAGPLREPLTAALKKCSVIIHLDGENAALPDAILQSKKPVWQVSATIDILPSAWSRESPKQGQQAEPALSKPHGASGRRAPEIFKCMAFAGIAHPELFRTSLAQLGVEVVEFAAFPDHHPYTNAEIETLINKSRILGVPLLTTEKDAARLNPTLLERDIYVVKQTVDLPETLISELLG